jgi:hypothetical protein
MKFVEQNLGFFFGFSLTACVIIEAEAFEIAQPEPLKATSLTRSSSIST